MEIYTYAAMDKERVAQQKTVDQLLSRDDGIEDKPYVPESFPKYDPVPGLHWLRR